MAQYSLTNATNLFKITYDKLSANTYNSANVLLARTKKQYDFVGKRKDVAVPLSFSGGVGSGTLPTANFANYEDAQIAAKKVYAVTEVEREAIKASATDEGAFVRMIKEPVKKAVESFNRNMSRILWNDGTGSLGELDAAATGTAADPIIVISLATWKEANIEEKDYINVTADTSVFEVVSVVPSTRTVTLSRVSGSLDLTAASAGDVLYMQNSRDNDPQGLKGVLDATSGSLYSVPVARRWQAYQQDAGAAGITNAILNEGMLEVEKRCGKSPNLIMTSYTQYIKIQNQLEDQKRYNISPRDKSLQGKVSFSGLEFMGSGGPVGIFYDRFIEDDRVYLLNDNFICIHHRPDFGWFDDDGTVFLRKANDDAYEARYGGYMEMYAPPSFHGVITNLAV